MTFDLPLPFGPMIAWNRCEMQMTIFVQHLLSDLQNNRFLCAINRTYVTERPQCNILCIAFEVGVHNFGDNQPGAARLTRTIWLDRRWNINVTNGEATFFVFELAHRIQYLVGIFVYIRRHIVGLSVLCWRRNGWRWHISIGLGRCWWLRWCIWSAWLRLNLVRSSGTLRCCWWLGCSWRCIASASSYFSRWTHYSAIEWLHEFFAYYKLGIESITMLCK